MQYHIEKGGISLRIDMKDLLDNNVKLKKKSSKEYL